MFDEVYEYVYVETSQDCNIPSNVSLKRWGLLADRYGLPIRDYWQTVWSANKRLLADRSRNI